MDIYEIGEKEFGKTKEEIELFLEERKAALKIRLEKEQHDYFVTMSERQTRELKDLTNKYEEKREGLLEAVSDLFTVDADDPLAYLESFYEEYIESKEEIDKLLKLHKEELEEHNQYFEIDK